MQAQDLQSALWAVGVRVPGAGLSDVRRALDDGAVVRSWPMRGTLHLVAAEDLCWLVELLGRRVLTGAATRRAQLDLTDHDVELARAAAVGALVGGRALRREALLAAMADGGAPIAGQRGYHLLWYLAQSGAALPDATTPPVPRKGLRLPDIQLHDPWMIADRATLGNMCPEYGATAAYFPVDAETLAYLSFTGRDDRVDLVERYTKEQGLFRRDGDPEPTFTCPRWSRRSRARSGRRIGCRSPVSGHRSSRRSEIAWSPIPNPRTSGACSARAATPTSPSTRTRPSTPDARSPSPCPVTARSVTARW